MRIHDVITLFNGIGGVATAFQAAKVVLFKFSSVHSRWKSLCHGLTTKFSRLYGALNPKLNEPDCRVIAIGLGHVLTYRSRSQVRHRARRHRRPM
jgi:hypothetical protein